MGRGIAQLCATGGFEVLLFDAAIEASTNALIAVEADLKQAVAKSKISEVLALESIARMKSAVALSELSQCDLVVEAIVERMEAKQELLRSLEKLVSNDCILATNTSSLSVAAIASCCEQPERVAGWHFFNPAPRMKVVEVIRAPRTATSVIAALVDVTRRFGHQPIETIDSPGFVVNHAGRAYFTESLKLLAENTTSHETLDSIMRVCAGFRMGPTELLDLTGLDVSVPVMESIHAQYYGDDRYRPVSFVRTRLQAGLLGRKSGKGFYDYTNPSASKVTAASERSISHAPLTILWYPSDTDFAPGSAVTDLLTSAVFSKTVEDAAAIIASPIDRDLSTLASEQGLDASKLVGIDPMFASSNGVTLMVCPATSPQALAAVQASFSTVSIPTFVISDSTGFAAPRIVACIVNLACEMAQQGIATPAEIDMAVRLGLGYPFGPFEWGERIGADRILKIMRGLYSSFSDQRYRPAPWLVRRAQLQLPLDAPDRQIFQSSSASIQHIG